MLGARYSAEHQSANYSFERYGRPFDYYRSRVDFQVTGMTIETFAFVEPFVALAAIYWFLTEITSYLGRQLECRFGAYLRP